MSLFQIVYGKQPLSIPTYILGSSNVEALDYTLSTREEILTLLRQNLLKAQERMNTQADSNITDYGFI